MTPHAIEASLTLIEAAKILPGRPHVNTVRRWGAKGFNGIRLHTFRCGNRVCTTRAYIEKFLAECSGLAASEAFAPQAHLLAESKLDDLGVTVK